MPEFDADYLSAPSALPYVFSVMMFPRDAEARRRFAQALLAGGVAESLASPARDTQPVDARIARFLYDAPKLKDVLGDRQMKAVEASSRFAGWTLGFILRAAEHGRPELASVGEAKRRASMIRSRTRQGRASSKTLDAAWAEYGCVAHLWLANRCIGEAGFERCGADREKLLVFLAGAENLRSRGEAWKHKHSEVPILDAAETWNVPASFTLPPVSVPLPPLRRLS